MRFINTFRLLVKNFKHALVLFLSKSIATLVVVVLCIAFIMPELLELVENPVTQEFFESFKNIFLALINHDLGNPSEHVDKIFNPGGLLNQLLDLLFSMRWGFVLAAVGCVLVYLIKCFVDEVLHFTVGSMINDKMSTYAETPFGTSFVANLGKASKYAGCYAAVAFILDVATLALICVFLRFLPLFLAAFLSMTLVVFVQAARMALTNGWMPAMTADGEKLSEAIRFKDAHEKKHLAQSFMLYTVLVYVVIIINVVAALCTFGSALLITVPTSYLLFICAQYVDYYTMKGKKYFITYNDIATNPDRGDHAHFFNYMEEAEKAAEESAEGVQEE